MKLKAKLVAAHAISMADRKTMFGILSRYYDGVCWESFKTDLAEKSHVILLVEEGGANHGAIQGFSTVMSGELEIQGKRVITVFSGDTILEPKHWGSPALGIGFIKFLLSLKFRNPLTPVYWFLISKGYKTYLLMSNNFTEFYPNPEKTTPSFEAEMMDAYYGKKYRAEYDSSRRIITFGDKQTCRLKEQVAAITEENRAKFPKIAFFETLNPGWERGDELACVAKMTFDMPIRYLLKRLLLKKKPRRKTTSELPAAIVPAALTTAPVFRRARLFRSKKPQSKSAGD
jgi:hypothetical protein